MKKVLTISIAAYNIEDYIENALKSLVVDRIMEKIEVLIVNDGSKDKTAQIAQKYVDKYPDTFILINKENGGYGSTINCSTRIARGKYFKQLDGDDWFDTDNLKEYIAYLEKSDSDLVITPFTTVYESDNSKRVAEYDEIPAMKEVSFDEYWNKTYIEMHAATFKTQLFIDNDIQLTEHCFYTDNEYTLYAIKNVVTMQKLPINIYMYRMGREEQSCSMAGYIKHFDDLETVIKKLSDFILNWDKGSIEKKKYIQNRLDGLIVEMYRLYTYMIPTKESKKRFIQFDCYIRKQYPDFEGKIEDTSLKIVLKSKYILYGMICRINRRRYRDRL